MESYLPLIQIALWVALILLGILILQNPLRKRLEGGAAIRVGPIEIGELANKVDNDRQRVYEQFLAYFTIHRANNGGTEAINGIIELHRRIAEASGTQPSSDYE